MKRAIIIQARFRSTRLPGKVLQLVTGKPLLLYLLERLRHPPGAADLVVATSTEETDNGIAELCRSRGVNCYRGPQENVAQRFREVCDTFKLDVFVRISADSPLMDPTIIDQAMDLFDKTRADVVTNIQERTFPKGESVEVVSVAAFRQAFPLMNRPEHFEHVTKYFYEQAQDFTIHNFKADACYSDIRFVVDTAEDLSTFTGIVQRMKKPHWEYGWKDILPLYREAAALPQTL